MGSNAEPTAPQRSRHPSQHGEGRVWLQLSFASALGVLLGALRDKLVWATATAPLAALHARDTGDGRRQAESSRRGPPDRQQETAGCSVPNAYADPVGPLCTREWCNFLSGNSPTGDTAPGSQCLPRNRFLTPVFQGSDSTSLRARVSHNLWRNPSEGEGRGKRKNLRIFAAISVRPCRLSVGTKKLEQALLNLFDLFPGQISRKSS